MIKLFPVVAATAVLASGTVHAGEVLMDEQTFTCAVSPGAPVAAGTINGDVEVVEWNSDQVQIEYTIKCDDPEELEALEVRCDTSNGICCDVRYPDNWDEITATVDAVVRLPEGISFDLSICAVNGSLTVDGCSGSSLLETVNGNVEVDNFSGELRINIVNGEINLSNTPGVRDVSLVNGIIRSRIASLDGDVNISTVDGTIDLDLSAEARVFASTVSGNIDLSGFSNFAVRDELVGSTAEFGSGEFDIDISTVSGNIEISR